MINIQVAYAESDKQKIIDLQVEEDSTIKQAIDKSGIKEYFNIDLEKQSVGIFSKRKPLDQIVKEGDRIEIYRDTTCKKTVKELKQERQNNG